MNFGISSSLLAVLQAVKAIDNFEKMRYIYFAVIALQKWYFKIYFLNTFITKSFVKQNVTFFFFEIKDKLIIDWLQGHDLGSKDLDDMFL